MSRRDRFGASFQAITRQALAMSGRLDAWLPELVPPMLEFGLDPAVVAAELARRVREADDHAVQIGAAERAQGEAREARDALIVDVATWVDRVRHQLRILEAVGLTDAQRVRLGPLRSQLRAMDRFFPSIERNLQGAVSRVDQFAADGAPALTALVAPGEILVERTAALQVQLADADVQRHEATLARKVALADLAARMREIGNRWEAARAASDRPIPPVGWHGSAARARDVRRSTDPSG